MSSRRIEDLNARFQGMVRFLLKQGQEAIAQTGWTLFITDGYRSIEEQNELYAQGRTKPGKIVTNAKGGQSAHNYGLAVDLAFQKEGKLSYDQSLYSPVYSIARALGMELGADWTGFSDKPHFQYPKWENVIMGNGGNTMPNMYKGYDLSNAESMKVAVDKLVEIIEGKYVEKSKYETDVKAAFEKGKLEAPQPVSQAVISLDGWDENGLIIQEQIGNATVTRNYKRK